MKLDIEIVLKVEILLVMIIVEYLGLDVDVFEFYGKYKVKLFYDIIYLLKDKELGKFVFVMVINLMFVGEGKLIVIVGFGDVFFKKDKKIVIVFCELLFGFIMGIKGGVIGGGYV